MNNIEYLNDVVKRNEQSVLHTDNIDSRLLHSIMGISDEAGELMGAAKKALMYNKPLDKVNIIEEFGDLLWYLFLGMDSLGITLEQVQEINSVKLNGARYSNGFSKDEAINRNTDKERQIMEEAISSLIK